MNEVTIMIIVINIYHSYSPSRCLVNFRLRSVRSDIILKPLSLFSDTDVRASPDVPSRSPTLVLFNDMALEECDPIVVL